MGGAEAGKSGLHQGARLGSGGETDEGLMLFPRADGVGMAIDEALGELQLRQPDYGPV